MRNIAELRKEIDRIDTQLLSLIKQRLEVAKEVGLYKKAHNLPIIDKAREKEVLEDKRKKALEANVNPELMQKIFRLLIAEARKVQ